MAATVTLNLTTISDCESTSGWSGGSTYSGFQREGSYCLGAQASEGTYHAYYSLGSAVDMTGKHIYSWQQLWGNPETKANGGFRIIVGDGTNRVAYYVGGSDDYGFQVGSWSCFVLNCDSPPANYTQLAGSSQPNFSAVTEVGVGTYAKNKAIGNVDNYFWDVLRYGTGIRVTGGTSSIPITFDDIVAEDESTAAGHAYGIIRKLATGVYGIQGEIIIGGSSDTYFEDSNRVIVFEDRAVSSTLYSFKVENTNAAGGTVVSFVLGEKSGNDGIKGCTFLSAGSVKFTFDVSNADVNVMKLYGCTFLDAGTITLPATATDKEVITCTFDSSSEVLADTCVVQGCSFINADDRGVRMSSTSHNITDSKFIACGHGVNIPNTGTYTFDNLQFSGNTYDIENSSGGDVTINATNGSNPSTYENTAGGTTTINNAVTISIHVEDKDGNPISGARVGVFKESDGTTLMSEETDTNGDATETYNYTGDVPILVRVRKSSASSEPQYMNYSTKGTITSSGYSLTVILYEDTIFS